MMTDAIQTDLPGVQILMGVLNGADFLTAQLDSIAAQTGVTWRLKCSDDGSTDGSQAAIEGFAASAGAGQLTLCDGPGQGFARNYLTMIADLPPSPGLVALADQDDIWFPDRLARAADALAAAGDEPALYCSQRLLWDPEGDARTPERTGPVTPSFRNALIENVAGGNTIVLNPAGAELARGAAARIGTIYAHDWWLYLLISGAGGTVMYDPEPTVLYRQHAGNAIGGGRGVRAQLHRKLGVLRGTFARRVALNIAALRACEDLLTRESLFVLDRFGAALSADCRDRLRMLEDLGLYRQSRRDSWAFWGAAALGRL